jgi:diaminopimelate epimerase
MRHPITFAKASGAGNDFVVIDNRHGEHPFDHSRFATAICNRRSGVGVDGLLVLEGSEVADFAMKYYNSDGSYGGMCGNGGRCIARYASQKGPAGGHLRFEALGFVYEAVITEATISLRMRDPRGYRPDIKLRAGGTSYTLSFIDTGAPHAVTFVSDLDGFDVAAVGRAIRYASEFAPAGVNVNFAELTGPSSIKLRTYERGVEAETLACGTGSIAASVVGARERGLKMPVEVRVRSGEALIVNGDTTSEGYLGITLEGGADILFFGKALYDDTSRAIQYFGPL